MARVTRATAREIFELESHAVTLNRALEYLDGARKNAQAERNLALMEWIDRESKHLTRELKRVKAERRAIQEELGEF